MLVKLHGTSGAGKSTVARELMSKATHVRPIKGVNGKIDCYECILPILDKPLFVLGRYITACGGLDTLTNVNDHIRLMHRSAQYGHVFYEGLLGSEYYGRIGQESERYGDDHIFAFLDTPVELCIERVKQRRFERKVNKPLNETNTRGRIDKINRLYERLTTEFHRRAVIIDHRNAAPQVLALYLKDDNDEPGTDQGS
jgi:cytidylate kinase